MRNMSLKNFLLTILLITLPLNKVIAADIECLLPQETVFRFYSWYLNEIKDKRYPLTRKYNGDTSELNKWVSSSLLSKLREQQLRGETDYDYFTYSQDFFGSWLMYINARVVKQNHNKTEVKLSLGEKDSLNNYKVELNHESCWKINSVQPAG